MLTALTDPRQPVNKKEVVAVSLIFLAISYLYLGANIFEGEIVAPMDIIMDAEGWAEKGLAQPVVSSLKGDVLDAWLPRWVFTKQRIMKGEIPLWNPHVAGGQPALPSLPDSYFTPSFLLFCMFEDGLGFTLGLLARLVLAGTGTYFFSRLALGRFASFFAGITFMMCGFNAVWLMWPQVATSAWIPWVLWGTLKLLKEPNCIRMTILSCLTTALLFGGFPAVAAYGLFLSGAFSLWYLMNCILKKGLSCALRRFYWLCAALLLSLPLGAIQILPFWEYLSHVDLSWRAGWGIPFSQAVLLFSPFREGNPHPEYCGYVGMMALLAAVASILLIKRFRNFREPFSPLFWMAAVFLTLAIVYRQPEYLVDQLYRLPVLNFNQNGRMLSIFGLEMALLAGIGLQQSITLATARFGRPTSRSLVSIGLTLMALVCSIQFFDLVRVGRSQNAIVPAESFYPPTPLIGQIQKSILPGQSVIHTYDAFRYPGVLTAYGLKDWFAHAHRLKNEKKLLSHLAEDPWVSPTAAVIFPEEVAWDSPYYDLFSVRFFLLFPAAVEGFSRPEGHILLGPGEKTRQSFVVDETTIVIGVQLLTAAYGPGDRPDCGIELVIKQTDETWIARQSLEKEEVRHHEWTTFYFESERRLDPGTYLLEFRSLGPPGTNPLVIGASPGISNLSSGSLDPDFGDQSGTLAFRILGTQVSYLEDWRVLQTESPVTLLENSSTPPGGFLVASRRDFENGDFSGMKWDDLQVLESKSEQIEYEVNCVKGCWQLQSARTWPGWKVYVDDTESPIESFSGLFPGVAVPAGLHLVSWRYEPVSWSYGWRISLVTIILLAGCLLTATLKPSWKKKG